MLSIRGGVLFFGVLFFWGFTAHAAFGKADGGKVENCAVHSQLAQALPQFSVLLFSDVSILTFPDSHQAVFSPCFCMWPLAASGKRSDPGLDLGHLASSIGRGGWG